MKRELIEQLRLLCDNATPCPWKIIELEGYFYFSPPDGHRMGHRRRENADFIAAARTALPELLDEVNRLESLVDDLTHEIEILRTGPRLKIGEVVYEKA